MRIFRSLEEAAGRFGPCALTIGNFDGVHAGHRRILRRVAAVAREHGWTPSALTFDPHPARVVAPERAPRLMTSPERRCELMAEEGIEQALILPFTRAVSELSPGEFARSVLCGAMGARAVLVGDNFRFGHGHAGDAAALSALGSGLGFTAEIVPAVRIRNFAVSSSAVRRLVESGLVARAWRLLERPFALEGGVVAGRGVGSKQTVPTLNLASATEVLPAGGVYVTCTEERASRRRWRSITNIGTRPTFDGGALSIETFLLDALDGESPQRLRVHFLRRLRAERKFESPEELKRQILRDADRAQAYFRRLSARWRGGGTAIL